MKILAVGPHPDDLEFAMSGTLIKLVEEGHEVVGVVLTKGEMGTRGTGEERIKEVEKAAHVIGYTLEMLDFQDTKIEDNNESRLKIANIIRKYKPRVVFAPYHTNTFSHKDGMAHPDHTATGHLVRHALRLAKFEKVRLEHEKHFVNHLIYYMIPKNKIPTFVNDVSKYVERMLEAMRAHQTQINEEFIERLFIFRKYYGFMVGAKYGEPFVVEDTMKFDIRIFE